jgi:D-beta-D-heptose 7-phosphate kinase/D-beta-D-heptose 1-phosphate adenosyltransferase
MDSILLSRPALKEASNRWRRQGKSIVFTNGVFDVLHRGHIDLFEKAKSYGDILVVGLNSDASTRRLKGPMRPVNRQADRIRVLSALRTVDHICLFPEDTPLNLILILRPHVLVKGSEYPVSGIVGAAEVRSWGGSVKRFKMRPGYSSTDLIRRIARP